MNRVRCCNPTPNPGPPQKGLEARRTCVFYAKVFVSAFFSFYEFASEMLDPLKCRVSKMSLIDRGKHFEKESQWPLNLAYNFHNVLF